MFLQEDIFKIKNAAESITNHTQENQISFIMAKLDSLGGKQLELEALIHSKPSKSDFDPIQKDIQALTTHVGHATTHGDSLQVLVTDLDERLKGLTRAVGVAEEQLSGIVGFFGASNTSGKSSTMVKSQSASAVSESASPRAKPIAQQNKMLFGGDAAQINETDTNEQYTWKQLCTKLNSIEESMLPTLEQHSSDINTLTKELERFRGSLTFSASKIHNMENAVVKNKQV